jgi:hypothetical protein
MKLNQTNGDANRERSTVDKFGVGARVRAVVALCTHAKS